MTMRSTRRIGTRLAAVALFGGMLGGSANAIPAVWTEHNDNNRSGDNLSETVLTPSNVNQSQFGALFHFSLDDETYSQPLYVPGLTMSVDNAVHNVVFVTTVNNSVYAFDADSNTANGGNPLWHVSLTPSGARPPNHSDLGSLGACSGSYNDFTGNFGIVGTPVIDTSTNTLYVVARDIENGSTYVQRLHALDCKSGAEKFGGPVVISGSSGGTTFNPTLNNQRTALALANGVVYIGWSSHCDYGAYHGYVIGYNASNLNQVAAWSATNSNGSQGGIWQGGQAPAVDSSNNLYFMTGNGTWDGSGNFGESFVKLAGGSLTLQDYFTPNNYSSLNGGDTDLGSAGCLLIPGTSYAFGGGKQGMVYLVNTANMGHESATDKVLQEFQATFPPSGDTGHIHGGPVWFNNGTNSYAYLWGENDYCRAFQWNSSSFNSSAVGLSTMKAPTSNVGMPGGFLSVSANGSSNGIVWALTPYNGDANHGTVAGILHAFNATPSSGALTELWNSQQNATRDSFGNYAKFTYPTVVNGKVYVPTFGTSGSGTGSLYVYGLLSSTSTAPAPPTNLTASAGNTQVTLSWTASSSATSYNVYRGTAAGAEATTPIATGITGTTYTDTGVTNGTTYYYRVAAVDSVGISAQSNEVSAALTSGSSSGGVSIDCGGAASGSYVADTDYSGGATASVTNTIDTSLLTGSIPPQAVLQSNRYGTCTYTIPGLSSGASYPVTLYFAEEYWSAAGKRVFNVSANGTTELSNFDIYATAGAQYKAVQKSFNVTANSSGQIVLTFTTVTDNAQVNAIVVGSGSTGGSAPTAPTGLSASAGNAQVSLAWTAVSGATSYSVYRGTTAGGEGSTAYVSGITATTYTNTGLTNGTTYYYKVAAVNSYGASALSSEVSATPAASTSTLSIDCGGAASGSFAADEDYSGGGSVTWANAVDTSLLTGTIPPQAVLQSDREGAFTYTIPGYTAGSSHTVTLYFVEQYWNASGKRVFSVTSNGTTVISNLDVYATAGADNKAIQKSFTTTANASGQIVLGFSATADQAKCGGIVIQ